MARGTLMMYIDIFIVLLIGGAAFAGYANGIFGLFKGIISKILGALTAWILTPLAQAVLESKWGVETYLAKIVSDRLPDALREMIMGVTQAANTVQDVRNNLLGAELPADVSQYLQRVLNKAPADTPLSPELVVDALAKGVARSVLWAFLFILIWVIASILIKGFISMIFVSGDGKTLLGKLDGFLGMAAMGFIMITVLLALSGLLYPIILFSPSDDAFGRICAVLRQSRLLNWMAGVYQIYVIPWVS